MITKNTFRHRIWPAVIAVVVFQIISCQSVTVQTYYNNGVVVSSAPIASEIGVDILKKGGNAFDAAVAVGFAMAVCYPEAGNLGGGGFALIYASEFNLVGALDFREKAPLAASRDMYLDEEGNVIPGSSLVGAGAVGVPGTVAGLYELWHVYGSMPWKELLKPAITLADTGFIVDEYLAGSLREYRDELSLFPETQAMFFSDGDMPETGERFTQPMLFNTLRRIALDTLGGFYTGQTADLIVRTMNKYGGLITHEDLANYAPMWRQPVHFKFDSLDIYSMPPPSSGGVILGQILKIIEPYSMINYTADSPEYIHLFAEACRLAYADRAVHLGDPDFTDNPVNQMLDSLYVSSRRKQINLHTAGSSAGITSGMPEEITLPESENTTHFCVADKDGNFVSLTYTLNAAYGSKLAVAEAGFLLNNEMDDFSIKPGVPNLYGLVGGEANSIAPGKRMLSSMSPTIILKKDVPVMAVGSPGGSKIITSVALTILNFFRYDMNLKESISQPRFHHQWLPDTLYLEENGFPPIVIKKLESMGHKVKERSPYSDVQAIYRNSQGMYIGASDPRGNGKPSGY